MKQPIRMWRFYVNPLDEPAEYLDENGKPNDPTEIAMWIGTDLEAEKEADRRADLWEDATGRWAWRVTNESRGKVKKS